MNIVHCEILCFLMPTFIFVTGYFSKGIARDENKRKVIANYVLLYCIFQIIKMFINESTSFFNPQYGNWFLVACILWYTFIPLFGKVKWYYGIAIAIIIGLLWGTNPSNNYVLHLSRVVVYFPFFLIGFYCNSIIIEKIKAKKCRLIGMLMLVPMLCSAYVYCQNIPYKMLQANTCFEDMNLSLGYGLLMRFVWYCLCIATSFAFLALMPRKKTIIAVVGTRTLPIYLLHMVLYSVLYKYFDYLSIYNVIPDKYILLYLLGVSVIMTAFFSLKIFSTMINKILKAPMGFLYK